MKLINELYFYLIYLSILIIKIDNGIAAKLNYCEIENLFCTKNLNNQLKLHVACNSSLNSKINNLDNKFFNGQIINLNDQLRHEILKNLNKFRNRLANGKIKMHPKPASKMHTVEWDDELENLSRISLELSKNGDHIGCTATEKYPNTREIFYRINYFPNTVVTVDDIKYLVEDIIRHFNLVNKNSIAIGSDETTHIGCTLARHNQKFLLLRCLVNKQDGTPLSDEQPISLYREGVPCSECDTSLTCSTKYKSLCVMMTDSMTRTRRNAADDAHQNKTLAMKPKSKHLIRTESEDGNDDAYDENDDDNDNFDDEDDENLYDDAPRQSKDYGDQCKGAEECHWPMVCEEMPDGKSICACDESYYYYDSALGTCLLDGYDMIEFVKQIVEEANNDIVIKVINNTAQTVQPTIASQPTIAAPVAPMSAEISEKDIKLISHDVAKRVKLHLDEFVKNNQPTQSGGGGDLTGTIIVAIIMAILSLITWIVFIIFLKRLENSFDRKLEEKSGFRSGVNSS